MKIAFVYEEMECLGIQYLSSVLKNNGYETKLFFDPQLFSDTVIRGSFLSKIFDYSEKIIESIEDYKPDIIAFSVLTTNYRWGCTLSKKIKKRLNIPIVFGGIHVTSLPEEIMKNDFVDYAIVGEGEYALLDLVQAVSEKKIPFSVKNLWFRHNGELIKNEQRALIQNLDSLPFPDKELFYNCMPYLEDSYTIITGRGCPHNCTFCCNSFINSLYGGRYLRRRSVENVISELCLAVKKYKIKRVFFDDSTFTYNRKWISAFAPRYRETVNLPAFCWVHPNDVDSELVNLLKMMSCKAVEMGVESLDPDIRKNLLHRYYDNSNIQRAIELFNKNKIFCVVDNIKGLYKNPEEEMSDFIRFYNQNRPKKIYIFEYRTFPRTKLAEDLLYKKEDSIWGLPPFTITTKSTSVRIRQMELLLILIYFMPRSVVRFLLNKRIYYIFPPVTSYNILEILPYFLNLIQSKKYRFWYPVRGTRRRYLHFVATNPLYFFKKVFKL